MQVRTDIVSSLTYISCIDLLRLLVEICPNDIKIVVKRHPYCKSFEIYEEIKKLEENKKIIVTNSSVHSIIKNCEAVFTANSGVGFEALMHLKPVYTTGISDYIYAVSKVLKSKKDIEEVLNNDFTLNRQKILKFLYFYNAYYVVNCTDVVNIESKLNSWLNNT